MCFLLLFSVLSFCCSQMFFSFQVEEHLVCSLPRVALKIHFKERHQERREETEANLFHSLSSSFFFPFVFRVCFVFIAHFTVIFSNSPSLFPSCHGTHPHVLPVGWKQNTPVLEKKKPFMGSQSLLRVGTRCLPFQWLTYSNCSLCQKTGTIRKASVSY